MNKRLLDIRYQNISTDSKGNIVYTFRRKGEEDQLHLFKDLKYKNYFYVLYNSQNINVAKSLKKQNNIFEFEKSNLVAFKTKKPLLKISCNRPWEVTAIKKHFQGEIYESDVSFVNKYLIDKFYNYELPFIPPRVCIIDIEVLLGDTNSFPDYRHPYKPINCIGIYDSYLNKYYQFVLSPNNQEGIIEHKSRKVYVYNDEEKLFKKFLHFLYLYRNDIFTGWNVQFDMRYLIKRMEVVLGEEKTKEISFLKRYRFNEYNSLNYSQGSEVIIEGVAVVDYLVLYKQYTTNVKEAYSLDFIAKEELGGTGKVDWSQQYKSLDELYYKDFNKFIVYNYIDIDLVKKINDKLKFIDNLEAITSYSLCSKEDYLITMKLVDGLLLQKAKRDGVALPTASYHIKKEKIIGAFVKEPKKGRFEWVVSFDLNSLYPNLISTLNISPETIVEEQEKCDDCIVAANNLRFLKPKKQQGFFSEVCRNLLEERKVYKEKMIEAKAKQDEGEEKRYYYIQYALKVLANSIYGVMSNERFRFYRREMAEAITKSGQATIQNIAKMVNIYLSKKFLKLNKIQDFVIASDTDSIYIDMGSVMSRFDVWISFNEEDKIKKLQRIGEQLKEVINKAILPNISEQIFNVKKEEPNFLEIKMETISDVALFLTKKRYILRLVLDDGVRMERKVKYVGVEIKRSDTSHFSKEVMKAVIEAILDGKNNKETNKIIENYKKKFREAEIEEIAFPIGVSKPLKEYDTKPIHIRGAENYNKYFARNENEKIDYGSKIKYLYVSDKFVIPPMKERTNVISFPDKCPIDRKYIDWDRMEERIIKQKILGIYEAMEFSFPGEKKQMSVLDF